MGYWLVLGDCLDLDPMLVLLILQWFIISCYICEMLCGYIVIFAGIANGCYICWIYKCCCLIAGTAIGCSLMVLLCCGAPLAVPQKGKVSTRVAVH